MIEVSRSEVLRYLGYHTAAPDEAVTERIEFCIAQLEEQIQPKSVWRQFPLHHLSENIIDVGGITIQSKALSRNLTGCSQAFLMAATLGVGPDRLLARASAVCMSDAVIYQAAAAAMIEAYCDEINDTLRDAAKEQGLYCRPRFSPGYGDFSIRHQQDFIRFLDTPRKIGLTVTESCLLAPIKSVTAIIGLSATEQPCHRSGCEMCENSACAFRR